jgi:hydroxymethylbilane synthase
MMREIKIGTRGSKLAIIQAEWVLTKLKEAAPGLKISLNKITTQGDQDSSTPLDKFAQEGIFVKELEKALLDGKIDLAVHSLKDLPTDIPHGLALGAVSSRLDSRDALISTAGQLDNLRPRAKIGTGSTRRAIQLLACRPDLETGVLRGNIDTRLRKAADGTFDGIIMAAAALIRLGWADKITQYLPIGYFLPAVGQGALGIEIRSDDYEIADLVSPVNHKATWQSIIAERTFLRALGGGCQTPIAALGTALSNNTLRLEGMVAGTNSKRILRSREEGDARNPGQIGVRLAQKMMKMGASEYISEAKPQ